MRTSSSAALIAALLTLPCLAPATPPLALERARATRALAALHRSGDALAVHWPPHRAWPTSIRGLAVRVTGTTDEARARSFLEQHAALFLDLQSTLRYQDTQAAGSLRVVRFQQRHGGLPVIGALVAVALEGDRVVSISNALEPISLPLRRAAIGPRAAVQVAVTALAGRGAASQAGSASLAILAEGGPARLVYRVVLPLSVDGRGRLHLVDARSGQYVGWRPGAIVEVRR